MKSAFLGAVFGSLASMIFASSGHATILTFDITNQPFNNPIPQDYGDRVTSTSMVSGPLVFNYGVGNGFTPNVVAEYAGSTVDMMIVSTPNSWPTDYGDLIDVVWGEGPQTGSDNKVTISLIADPGFRVLLNSFDIAAWTEDRQTEILEVDVDGSVTDLSSVVLGNVSHSTFSPNVSGQRIDIAFGNGWWFGVDNVDFDQRRIDSVPAPEPFTLLLIAFGLGGIAACRRRSR